MQHDAQSIANHVRVKLARAPGQRPTAESFGNLWHMTRTEPNHYKSYVASGGSFRGDRSNVAAPRPNVYSIPSHQEIVNDPTILHFVAHHPDQASSVDFPTDNSNPITFSYINRNMPEIPMSSMPWDTGFEEINPQYNHKEMIDQVSRGHSRVAQLLGVKPSKYSYEVQPTVYFKSHQAAKLAAMLSGGHVESVAFHPREIAKGISETQRGVMTWKPRFYDLRDRPESARQGISLPAGGLRLSANAILRHPVFGEYITKLGDDVSNTNANDYNWIDARNTHRRMSLESNGHEPDGSVIRDYGHPPTHFDPGMLDDTGKDLHSRIVANPGDHLARAVLADHLDNVGHHEHADNWRQTLPLKFAKNKSTPQEVPILTPEIGINVNDKRQAFTEQILNGAKTIETRNASTLHPYVGKKMGLVRTGKGKAMLVGYVTIGEPKLYTAQSSFDKDFDSHLVGKDSPFHISKSKKGSKWGYALSDVEKIEPRLLKDGTGVAPNPRVARKLQNAASPVRYSSAQSDVPSSTLPSDKPASASFGSTKDWVTKNDPHHSFMNERRQILPWRYTPQDLKSNLFGPVRHRSHDDAQLSSVHFIAGHSAQMSPIDTLGIAEHHEIRPLISVLGLRPQSDEDNYRRYPYEESSYMPMSLVPYNRSGFAESGFASVVGDNARLMNRKVLEHLGVQYKPLRDSNRDMRELFNPMFKDRQAAERIAKTVGGYVHTVHIDPSTLRGKFPRAGRPSGEMGGMTLIDQRKSGDAPRDLSQSVATLAKHPDYGEYIVTHNPSRLTKEGSFFHRTSHFAGSLARAERARFDHFGSTPEQIRRRLLISPVEDSHIRPLISQYWQNLIDLHSEFHEDPYHHSDKTDYHLPRVLSADGLGADHTPPTTHLIYSMGDDARHLYAMALADHSEPAPRIVLADLFDEHGHEGAANFMRASVPHQASGQVKLAKDSKPDANWQPMPGAPVEVISEIPGVWPTSGVYGGHADTPGKHVIEKTEGKYKGKEREIPEHRIYAPGGFAHMGPSVARSEIAPETQQAAPAALQPAQQQFPAPPAPLRHPEISARMPFAGNQGMLEPGDIIHTYYVNKDSSGNPVHSPMHLTPRLFRELSSDGKIVRSSAINEDGTVSPKTFAAPATGDESPSFAIVQRAAVTRSRAIAGNQQLFEPSAQPSQPAAALPQSNVTADHFRHWNISHTQGQLTPEQIADAHFNVGDDVHIRRDNGRMDTGTYRRINLTPSGDIEHVVDLGGSSGDVTVRPEDVWHWSGASSTHPAFRSPSNWDQINSEIKDKTPGRRIWVNTGFHDKGMENSAPEFLNQYRRATLVNVNPDGAMSVRLDGGKDAINVSSDRVRDNTDQSYPHVDRFDGSPISVIDTAGGAIYHGVYRGMARQRQDGQSVREAIAEAGLPYGENWTDPNRGPERFVHVAEINTPDGPLPTVVEREDILPRFAQGITHNELNEDPRSAKAMLLKIASLFEEQGLDPDSVVSMRERAAELGTRPVRAVKPPVIESSTKAVPGNKLERIISNSGERNYQDVADSMRDKFREIFGKDVDDETIMDILRVPRAFPGADPNHPAFSPENIELDAAIYSDNVGSRVKSKLPNYKFSASTIVGLNKASNNSQHHGGVKITHDKFISTPHILQNQANAAHSLGIKKLGVSAALDNPVIDPHNGYTGGIVWPTYGYTKDLNEISDWDEYTLGEAIEIARRNNPSLHAVDDDDLTLNHLLDSKEGIDWYTRNEPHKNGGKYYPNATSGYMQFHTDPSSDSHRILARKTRRLEQNAASRKNPS